MTPADVADRIYDYASDLTRGESGIVLPSTPLGIATRIVLDIIEGQNIIPSAAAAVCFSAAYDNELVLTPECLGQAVAYVVERVRPLLPDEWKTLALDQTAAEILYHTTYILGLEKL